MKITSEILMHRINTSEVWTYLMNTSEVWHIWWTHLRCENIWWTHLRCEHRWWTHLRCKCINEHIIDVIEFDNHERCECKFWTYLRSDHTLLCSLVSGPNNTNSLWKSSQFRWQGVLISEVSLHSPKNGGVLTSWSIEFLINFLIVKFE